LLSLLEFAALLLVYAASTADIQHQGGWLSHWLKKRSAKSYVQARRGTLAATTDSWDRDTPLFSRTTAGGCPQEPNASVVLAVNGPVLLVGAVTTPPPGIAGCPGAAGTAGFGGNRAVAASRAARASLRAF
jgi:hypothetical protein